MALFKKTKTKKIPSENIIVLDKVSKSYATGAPALNGISLTIKQGEFVFIVGDSGSGKSTLIKLLLRELLPTSGDLYVNGQSLVDLKRRNVPKYRRNLGVVFQDFRLLKDRNVYENVAFAQRIIQVPTREIRKNVPSILSVVGLGGKYKAKPRQLSGIGISLGVTSRFSKSGISTIISSPEDTILFAFTDLPFTVIFPSSKSFFNLERVNSH